MNWIKQILHWIKKWKLVDKSKYSIIPSHLTKFVLSEKQEKQVEQLYEEKGSMDYYFHYTGIGIVFEVKIWETGEVIDLTDYDTW